MKVRFAVPFEEPPEQPIELAAYVTDRAGNVVASAPVSDGNFELDIDKERGGEVSIGIAPVRSDLGDRLPTRAQLARLRAYEPVFEFDPSAKRYELQPIPAAISTLWWLCLCRVRGRVVKPVASGGVTVDMPVCHARVHICEMDPIWIWLDRLPDPEIFRLRDDFLQAVKRPGPPPIPDPGPVEIGAPTPWLPGPAPAMRAATEAAAEPSESRVPASSLELPLESRMALSAPGATTVRRALLAHAPLIQAYLCWWPWWWPWLWRCDELAVIDTDDNGRFDVGVAHLCGDAPDLYFWVEYFLNGVWTTVYAPWRPCGTYWDFDCASEVTLRITDPRVPYCGGHDSPEGKVVVVKSIGNDISISEILGAAVGLRQGLTVWPAGSGLDGLDAPFANTLELRVDFGDALVASGVTKYRWSYRQVSDASGGSVTDVPHVMTRQVVRHYRTFSGGNPIDLIHPLGPLPNNFFEVWNPVSSTTPAGDHNWQVDDAREDLVSGFFETGPLDPTRTRDTNVTGHHLDDATAGLYELTLELFHADDSLVDWTAEGIGLFETNVPAPFGANPVTTQSSPPDHRILDSGDTKGFRLQVHVDNSFCESAIFDVTASGHASGPCGFIDYAPGATAHLSVLARHVHDFAAFWFEVDKGSSGTVAPATIGAWAPVGVSPVNGFTRDANWVFSKDIPVRGPCGTPPGSLVDCPTACPGGRAAFAETSYVAALATDGWSRASNLDAGSTPKAFALTPAPAP
jgi:hypothetical protein